MAYYSRATRGEGCFGKVVKEKYNGTWAAVKKVPIDVMTTEELQREYRVYSKLDDQNVVKILGHPWLQDGKWHIPMELISGEDLETTLFDQQKSKIQLTPRVKAFIIAGMCKGLHRMHSNDIVHQDLKPDNIMIEHGTHRAVIIDLGLAKFFVNGLSSAQNLGNEAYSAPEVRRGGVRDKRSDVWAMGKIIVELITESRMLTTAVSPLEIGVILNGSPYCNIVSKMVETNASKRPDMLEVMTIASEINLTQGGTKGKKVSHFAPTPSARPSSGNGLPAFSGALVPQFSQMSIPCSFPAHATTHATMTYRHYDGVTGQMEFKKIVTQDGNVVDYKDLKVNRNQF